MRDMCRASVASPKGGFMERLRVIFMGTPEFAVPSLAALMKFTEIICVVTQPDRPKGRGHKLLPSPVKIFAQERNLPIMQPERVKKAEIVEKIAEMEPDLIVVVAFGQILSQKLLDIPKFGCINVHGSLLPKYRGAAPIEWAIINGEAVTGITTMKMDAGLDTGDILLKKEVEIGEKMILPELRERLMTIGAELLIETVKKLQKGELEPKKQDDSQSSYAPLIKKETGLIDWKKSALELNNLIRGLYGGARAGKYKIFRSRVAEEGNFLGIGEIEVKNGRFYVGTGAGVLEILEMQAPGAKKMTATEFLRGNKVGDGFWTSE